MWSDCFSTASSLSIIHFGQKKEAGRTALVRRCRTLPLEVFLLLPRWRATLQGRLYSWEVWTSLNSSNYGPNEVALGYSSRQARQSPLTWSSGWGDIIRHLLGHSQMVFCRSKSEVTSNQVMCIQRLRSQLCLSNPTPHDRDYYQFHLGNLYSSFGNVLGSFSHRL